MIAPLHTIISRLRLRQLRLLIALDEKGSLHRAAEEVAISQPGATKALHELEDTFGTPLFTRTSQGLVANDLGRCVIRYARLIHNDLVHMRNEMMGVFHGAGGYVSTGAIMGAVPYVTQTVAALRRKQPDLSVEIIESTSANLLGLLDEGRLDFAICRASVSRRPDAYDYRNLQEEAVAIVGHPEFARDRDGPLTLADLSANSWVVYPANMPMRVALEREFGDAGLEFPRYPIETASTFVLLSMIQQDPSLVGLIPSDVAEFSERFGLIRRLPIAFRSRTEPYGVVTRRNGELSQPAQLVVHALLSGQEAPARPD